MEFTKQHITQVMTGEISGDGDFAEYMQEVHMEENPTVLDDDLPDHYSDWLTSLERSDIERYAKDWGAAIPSEVAEGFIKKEGLNI